MDSHQWPARHGAGHCIAPDGSGASPAHILGQLIAQRLFGHGSVVKVSAAREQVGADGRGDELEDDHQQAARDNAEHVHAIPQAQVQHHRENQANQAECDALR